MTAKSTEHRERFEIRGEFDSRGAEALRLELIWLAQRHGLEVEDFVVEPVVVRRPRRSAGRSRSHHADPRERSA